MMDGILKKDTFLPLQAFLCTQPLQLEHLTAHSTYHISLVHQYGERMGKINKLHNCAHAMKQLYIVMKPWIHTCS